MKNKIVSSSVFRKFVMAITGLLLVGFVITHLSGNLLLYVGDGELFNAYAHKLAELGILLYVAEAALAFFILFHAVTGIRLAWAARQARPQSYVVTRSKGGESKWGPASNNMAITGTILLIFIVVHIWHFKFGPGIEEGYTTQVEGIEVRDLNRLVQEQFSNLWVAIAYVVAMGFLGFHLRHGVWSALQSLGLTRTSNNQKLYVIGSVLGILLAIGFLTIPVYLYFFGAGAQ